MNIIANGYKFDQYFFKAEEKARAERVIQFFYLKMKELGYPSFFEDGILDENQLTIKNLEDIISWKKGVSFLEDLSHKFLMIREVKMVKQLITESEEFVSSLKKRKTDLFDKLREDFSKNVQNNAFLSNYFSFKDFKDKFETETRDEAFNNNSALFLDKDSLFDIIRKKIISSKMNNSRDIFLKDEKINISDIYQLDPELYELLRIEFFSRIIKESLGYKVHIGKQTHTEIVKNFDKIGELLNLAKTEIAYFTMSLNPIPKLPLENSDHIEFGSGLKFDVLGKKESYKIDMFYEMEIDEKIRTNLVVPIYFSYMKCKLVKEQRTKD